VKLKSEGHSMPTGDVRQTGVRRMRYYTPDSEYTPHSELDSAQLAGALDCSSQPLIVVDGFGRVCAANSAAAQLLGAPSDRLQHSYVQNHLPALDSEVSVLDQALDGHTPIDVRLPDGRRASATLSPLLDGRGQPTHACIAIAPSRAAADAGLEAVGRLVAEVAHDINNQLSAALNYVFILRRRLGADPELAQHFEELQSTAWRAATLTSGLKLLGPKRSSDAELLNVAAVIELLVPLLRHVAAGTQIEFRLAHALPAVHVPRAHLEQLIVMLTLSAAARAHRRGTVVVRTETRRRAFADSSCVRVVWDLHRVQDAPGLTFGANGTRAHGSLRRAIRRCHALPGHDSRRIWIDLAAASSHSGK
jgi:nitrogen-specific signal transduction histidine kinase